MAQHDYLLADQNGVSFLSDLNDSLAAIVSNNSGATAPSTTYAYQWWADTTSGVLKQRNAANSSWIDKISLTDGLIIGTDVQAYSANIATTPASQVEMEAGTETALRSMSPIRVKQAIDALSSGGLGVGQTWQDLTASRSISTVYTNSTGQTIAVSVEQSSGGSASPQIVNIGGVEIARNSIAAVNTVTFSFLVPDGDTYEVTYTGTVSAIVKWSELR